MQIALWILLFLLSFAAGFFVYRADKARAVPLPWLSALLRALVVGLTLMLLFAPDWSFTRNRQEKPIIVWLQDNSASVPLALRADSVAYRQQAQALLSRLRKNYNVVTWGFGSDILPDTLFDYRQTTTNIQAALLRAAERYGQNNLGAIILATDGQFNEGANPQFLNLDIQAPIYTIALGDTSLPKDLFFGRVYANKTVARNSQFEIAADVLANACQGYAGTLTLSEPEAGAAPLQTKTIAINSPKFDRKLSFTLQAGKPGVHRYRLQLQPAPGEANTSNNQRDVFIEVIEEKKKILLAAAAPHPDVQAIRDALTEMDGVEIKTLTAANIPPNLDAFDALIFHGLPSQQFTLQALSNSQKPVWFIVSSNTYAPYLNSNQQTGVANINPAALQPQFATLKNGFSAFILPQQINAVLDKMPPLFVPVGAVKPSVASQTLLHVRGNEQTPLWLLSTGAKPSALLAAEGIWRWRLFEYRYFKNHQVIDELIRQTVLFLTANATDKPFDVNLPKSLWSDTEPITLGAYVLNNNNEQINTPDVRITITDSANKQQQYLFEKFGNAYRLNLGTKPAGAYRFTAQTSWNNKPMSVTGSFIVQQAPTELLETGVNYPLLYNVARKYQGAVFPFNQLATLADSLRNNTRLKPVIHTSIETKPLIDWQWLFALIVAFATAEWLLRKFWGV